MNTIEVKNRILAAATTATSIGVAGLAIHAGPITLAVSAISAYAAYEYTEPVSRFVHDIRYGSDRQRDLLVEVADDVVSTMKDTQLYDTSQLPQDPLSKLGRLTGVKQLWDMFHPEAQPMEADEYKEDVEVVAEVVAEVVERANEMPSQRIQPARTPVTFTQRQKPEDHFEYGPNFFVYANDILSHQVTILGIPGMGKSNLVSVVAEEFGAVGIPFIIFDIKPEYTKLCTEEYCRNPFIADATTLPAEHAFELGQKIINERLQVVLTLPSYKTDDERARVMIDIVKGIRETERTYANEDRIPCAIIMEEAHIWLTQGKPMNQIDKTPGKRGQTLYGTFQSTMFSAISVGRSEGIAFILSSQRPAQVDKRAISMTEWKILFKANMPGDLATYKGLGCDVDASVLSKGEAYVVGPGSFVQGKAYGIRKKYSPDDAKTPGIENLRKNAAPVQVPYRPTEQYLSSAYEDVTGRELPPISPFNNFTGLEDSDFGNFTGTENTSSVKLLNCEIEVDGEIEVDDDFADDIVERVNSILSRGAKLTLNAIWTEKEPKLNWRDTEKIEFVVNEMGEEIQKSKAGRKSSI